MRTLLLSGTCLLSIIACAGGDKDGETGETSDDATNESDTAPTGDSGTTGDSVPTEPTGDPCTPLSTADDWAWEGECPQMYTPCNLLVEACVFTIDYSDDGGMTMGMPHSGTIEGDTVYFDDDSNVKGCVGTIVGDDEIEGTCGDGCTFRLSR